MPRIFHVTIERQLQLNIVAESAEEAQAVLDDCCSDSDFDDWNPGPWTVAVYDPLRGIKKAEKIPTSFEEPEMGILNGEAVNIYDYKKKWPNYMAEVEEDARQAALKLNTEKLVPKLPGV